MTAQDERERPRISDIFRQLFSEPRGTQYGTERVAKQDYPLFTSNFVLRMSTSHTRILSASKEQNSHALCHLSCHLYAMSLSLFPCPSTIIDHTISVFLLAECSQSVPERMEASLSSSIISASFLLVELLSSEPTSGSPSSMKSASYSSMSASLSSESSLQ